MEVFGVNTQDYLWKTFRHNLQILYQYGSDVLEYPGNPMTKISLLGLHAMNV